MESNRGPSAYQPKTLPLGQTGSHFGGGHLAALYTELRYQSLVGKGFGGWGRTSRFRGINCSLLMPDIRIWDVWASLK